MRLNGQACSRGSQPSIVHPRTCSIPFQPNLDIRKSLYLLHLTAGQVLGSVDWAGSFLDRAGDEAQCQPALESRAGAPKGERDRSASVVKCFKNLTSWAPLFAETFRIEATRVNFLLAGVGK